MQNKKVRGETRWTKAVRVGAFTTLMAGAMAATAPGCLDRPLEPIEPRITTTIVERLTQSSVDKIDLLLVLDNSRSMADKQEILGLAVPDLVNELVNPWCIDDAIPPNKQPVSDPLADCPDGYKREFDPILNIHIGIITSSVGGHGADACSAESVLSENDKAHLVNRTSTDPGAPEVAGWDGHKFLVWDPSTENPTHVPQGETVGENLITNLSDMVMGVGEIGCGYEATLEAWYRFLVDPDPYDEIEIVESKANLVGRDETLLTQRADFMRPDSLLAIIMLSDENDCSIRDGGQFYFAAQIYQPGSSNPYHLPKPRAACADDPNSDCCRSCGQSPADGCSTANDNCDGQLSNLEDNINLRCYDQKRRFGIDFLWPIDRYLTGLTAQQVTDRHGSVVPNPLFTDLNPDDGNSTVRDAGLVFVAGIVGVPWQDIARQREDGTPNLLDGLNDANQPVGGFMSGDELAMNNVWDIILGDPANSVEPTDPLMMEQVEPRSGANPVTGDVVQPPGAGNANPINGSEYSIPDRDDLQYACIFDLPTTRDCSDPNQIACDCSVPGNDNPLCNEGTDTLQDRAKAYPGVRELRVLKGAGTQGIVASICPEQLSDNTLFNFGYRPAIGAIVERLKQALGGQCLPRSLTPNAEGQVACLIIEARTASTCDCSDANARVPIEAGHPAINAIKEDPLYDAAGWNCFCEIPQTLGVDLEACQSDVSDTPVNSQGDAVHGWCYVDATTVPPTGNPEIVANCPETEKRIIRFVGNGKGGTGATLFITCSGE